MSIIWGVHSHTMYARDTSHEPIRTDRRHDATREMVGVVAAARAPDGLLCEIMCVRSNEATERERRERATRC